MSAQARPTAAAGEMPVAAVAEPSDESLARCAAAGDRSAFARLVGRYDRRVFRFAMMRVGSRDDAAEVTQETFLRAWGGIGRFDAGRRFSTWLLSIAHRESVNVIRRRVRSRRDQQPGRVEKNEVESAEDLPPVWSLAKRVLEGASYEAVWLRYAEDRSPAEIALVMGRTAVGVRVLLHRARVRLAAAAGDEGWTEAVA